MVHASVLPVVPSLVDASEAVAAAAVLTLDVDDVVLPLEVAVPVASRVTTGGDVGGMAVDEEIVAAVEITVDTTIGAVELTTPVFVLVLRAWVAPTVVESVDEGDPSTRTKIPRRSAPTSLRMAIFEAVILLGQ